MQQPVAASLAMRRPVAVVAPFAVAAERIRKGWRAEPLGQAETVLGTQCTHALRDPGGSETLYIGSGVAQALSRQGYQLRQR